MPALTISEINDIIRTVWCRVNVIFYDSVASAPNKEEIIKAVQGYRFPKNSDCVDHDFGIFEVENQKYFFSIDGTATSEEGQEREVNAVITIGRADEI